MLFNFNLVPVQHVHPWGESGDLNLHWFGLTDGQYWIEAGKDSLFEYSDDVCDQHEHQRFCEYYVVRLHEDLLEMLPRMLEPIPPSLVSYISGRSGHAWQAAFRSWSESNDDPFDKDQFWEIADVANQWTWDRYLDNGYLSTSARIYIWSDETMVHIEWDNRDKMIDGNHAWSAIEGTFALPRDQFISEVQSFHSRLMEQMAERVEQVLGGVLNPDIQIDMPGLQREHEHRYLSLDGAMASSITPTDWPMVHEAIREVERITQCHRA